MSSNRRKDDLNQLNSTNAQPKVYSPTEIEAIDAQFNSVESQQNRMNVIFTLSSYGHLADVQSLIYEYLTLKELASFSEAIGLSTRQSLAYLPNNKQKAAIKANPHHHLAQARYSPLFVHTLYKAQNARDVLKARLLSDIVYGQIPSVIHILTLHPDLLFEKGQVKDPVGRVIYGSAYQVILGAGDVWALEQVQDKIIPRITHGQAIAHQQFYEQFPYYNEPLAAGEDEETRLYDPRNKTQIAQVKACLEEIVARFTEDPCTNGFATLDTTMIPVDTLRRILTPTETAEIITTGLHFPPGIMKEVYRVYDNQPGTWDTWGPFSLYSRTVIGLVEAMSTTVDGQCYKQGLSSLQQTDEAWKAGPDRQDGLFCRQPKGLPTYTPSLAANYLGRTGFVDLYDGVMSFLGVSSGTFVAFDKMGSMPWAGWWSARGGTGSCRIYVEQKQRIYGELCSQLQRSQDTQATIMTNHPGA